MSISLSILGGAGWQFFDDNGVPLAGGKIWTYQAGTTTPATTYADSTGLVANPNPIILDAAGRIATQIWLLGTTTYKLVLLDSTDVEIWSEDNITASSSAVDALSAPNGSNLVGFILGDVNSLSNYGTAVARTVQSKLREVVSVIDFGADPSGATDSTTAIANAYATGAPEVYYPAGTYLVLGNFARPATTLNSGPGAWLVGGNLIYVDSNRTHAAATTYVSTTGNDTLNHGLSSTYPFATPQRAFDSLPLNIEHKQTISLAAGTYNTSSRPSNTMPRPAILYTQGKNIGQRTDAPGSVATGMVLLQGASTAGTIIQTNGPAGYTYGVYVTRAELAIDNLTIRGDTSARTHVPLTSHRSAYVHCTSVKIDGAGLTLATVCEAGGFLETVNCVMTGANTPASAGGVAYDLIVYANSYASIASPSSGSGILGSLFVAGGCQINTGMTVTNPYPISVVTGGDLTILGSTTRRTPVSGVVTVSTGSILTCSLVDFSDDITVRNSTIDFTQTGWAKTLSVYGSSVRLRASNSFITGATQSTVAIPMFAYDDSSINFDDATTMVNSSGARTWADLGNQNNVVTANGSVIPIVIYDSPANVQIRADGGNYTGCTLANVQTVGTTVTASPPSDGQTLFVSVSQNANTVQLVNGTTAFINGGSITLGVGAAYGVGFVWSDAVKRWVQIT